MIRLFVRCTRVCLNQNIFGQQANCVIPSTSYIITSAIVPVRQIHVNQLSVTNTASIRFVSFLRKELKCSKDDAAEIFKCSPEFAERQLSDMKCNIDLLLHNGVTPKLILDNPWMLTQNTAHLSCNLETLERMKPKNINDFAPLLGMSELNLLKIEKIIKSEEDIVPEKNRIYYLSHMMNIEPNVISKALSKKLFIFHLPYATFNEKLTIMLKYIAPMDILNDLLVFSYPPAVIESRLIQAKKGHKTKLMPWMVRCLEGCLLKSIKISLDEKAVLGEKSLVEYLSNRLQFDIETTETILKKHPQVFNVRVTRMKEILDYLLDEAGYTALDIAKVPRIFCHSLKTTRERLNELQSHGCRPQSLTVVCKSANEYRKFLTSWVNVREQLKERKANWE